MGFILKMITSISIDKIQLDINDSNACFTCANTCYVEAGAAGWNLGAKVEVEESKGAEDGLRGEGGQDADEDKAGEQDEGRGQHC